MAGAEQAASGLIVRLADAKRALTTAAIGIGLAGAWLITYWAGGTSGTVVHVFYLPVMVAATRFGPIGAAVAGIAAGVAAGPLMPLDADAGLRQSASSWLIRLGFFVGVGATVAFLSGHSTKGLREMLEGARVHGELQRAIDRRELRLVYQPIFELATGRLTGVEALVRWSHPSRGDLSPAAFIPAAERSGVIRQVDLHVLAVALDQLSQWRRHVPREVTFTVAVNLSAVHLTDDTLAATVAETARTCGVHPSAICLEITESAVVADIALAIERVNELRALGVRIAIDDFGTGHSSLAYLHAFTCDVIKLDRSFVAASADQRVRALTRAIVQLAGALGAATVAEGIETEEQADAMRHLGTTCGQGYYYACPSPPEAITRILAMAAPASLRTR